MLSFGYYYYYNYRKDIKIYLGRRFRLFDVSNTVILEKCCFSAFREKEYHRTENCFNEIAGKTQGSTKKNVFKYP